MSAHPQARPLVGVVLMSVAVFLFAASDSLGKDLFERYPVPMVQGARYFLTIVLMLVFFWPKHRKALWQTRRTGLVIARSLALAIGSLSMGHALQLMPIGEAVAIIYLSPFAVMLLSGPFLGEKVKPVSWVFAAVGFFGVLTVLRPGAGLDPLGVTFALLNAAVSTFYLMSSRSLARTESTHAMLFWTAIIGTGIFWVLALPNLPSELPPTIDMIKIGALGVLATVAHFLFTAAFREAPPSLLAPLNYTHVVWAALMGIVVFGHLPDHWTILGMAMIICAGMASAIYVGKRPSGS